MKAASLCEIFYSEVRKLNHLWPNWQQVGSSFTLLIVLLVPPAVAHFVENAGLPKKGQNATLEIYSWTDSVSAEIPSECPALIWYLCWINIVLTVRPGVAHLLCLNDLPNASDLFMIKSTQVQLSGTKQERFNWFGDKIASLKWASLKLLMSFPPREWNVKVHHVCLSNHCLRHGPCSQSFNALTLTCFFTFYSSEEFERISVILTRSCLSLSLNANLPLVVFYKVYSSTHKFDLKCSRCPPAGGHPSAPL